MATASGTKSENFKTICAKDNMSLRKNNDMNLFSLEYMYENPNFEITSLLNVNLYNLLFQVNKDIIDTIEVTPAAEIDKTAKKDNNEYYILFLLKEISMDLGGVKRYMYVHTQINTRYTENEKAGTEIIFTSKSVPYYNHEYLISNKYKVLEYPLYIQKYIIIDPHRIQVIHMFKLKPKGEELTFTVENAIGIFIKKIQYRLKQAIEQLRL